ncbi:MAG: hypothetical protein [Circular genetic element sp.]|nr:MAG: hypothetical protein [Circular genetic element sp.]
MLNLLYPKEQMEFYDRLVDKDIIGLDPRYNLVTPFDLAIGTFTKGYQGAKGVYTGVKLIHAGFSGYGKRALLGGLVDFYGFGNKAVDMFEHFISSGSSGGWDAKPGTSVPPVGPVRPPRPIKPSRPVSSGQTSKPFWSKGKPKCKKGFRYDFKRKLCVKIK